MTRHHLLAASALLFCGSLSAQTVSVQQSIPYSDDAEISSKVRDECVELNTQLSDFTRDFAKEGGIAVEQVDAIDPSAPGRVLQLEIVEAVSMGNAFIGHQKYSRVAGKLFEDGQQVAAFKGRRNSMGGAFAGYKGSCSVLGRTVKALGKDIALWLANPEDGARLGDM